MTVKQNTRFFSANASLQFSLELLLALVVLNSCDGIKN